jgi:hypothetical protein
MSNGSHDAGAIPPDALRCPNIHSTAADLPTSINPNPHCPGRCRLLKGHPHPGGRTKALDSLGAAAAGALGSEASEFLGVWEYNPGRCCKCEICHRWVRDWGMTG